MTLIRSSPLTALFSVVLVTATLYLGKSFLMPLALSVLLAFLLAPVVARLECWGIHRIPAVTLVALFSFALLAVAFYVVAAQLVDLLGALPSYQANLRQKVLDPLEKLSSLFSAFAKDLQPVAENPRVGEPMPVEVVSGKVSVFGVAREYLGPMLAPLGTAAVVVVNVIFFLFDRQALRDRFIHLVGRGRLHLTTQAIDDASHRVSRYLGAQLLVNVTYGIPIGIGLHFIGIPNAALCGLLAIILRFIPYIGAWIAAAFPIALAVASSPSWTPPLAAIGLFVAMELFSNNVVEPWLYGASTGLSASAIIVAAVFWTWLWGTGGLLLATPLTVCLAVLGKYVPALGFLHILLGDHPPIAPESRFYQRLLAEDQDELDQTILDAASRGATLELFDDVILPALRLAEDDLASGDLTADEQKELYRHLRDALANLPDFKVADDAELQAVVIAPVRTEGDALAGAMLAHLLRGKGIASTSFSERTLASEVQSRIAAQTEVVLCLSALTPTSAHAAASMFKRLGSSVTGLKLLGFWRGDRAQALERAQHPGVEIIASFADAVKLIVATSAVVQLPVEAPVKVIAVEP